MSEMNASPLSAVGGGDPAPTPPGHLEQMTAPPLAPLPEAAPPGHLSQRTAPAPPAARNAWDMQAAPLSSGDRFDRDKFFVNRKVLSFGNKYFIYDENNAPIFYVDRPVFKIKAHFGVFADETKNQLFLNVNQDSALAIINDSFTIQDANGITIGQLKRSGWMSMIRRTWRILDATGIEVAHATEDSMWKALLRRTPYIGVIMAAFFRTNFNIIRPSGAPVGAFIRRITLADKHVLDLSADAGRQFDRRLAVALALVLDNAESRHQNH